MRKIKFTKMVASGNDFIVSWLAACPVSHLAEFARRICDRKFGVGADGLLVLDKSKGFDVRMRVFNPDGSEAKMCGNGARCAALYAKSQTKNKGSKIKIQTMAGIINAEVNKDVARIKLTEPKGLRLNIPLTIKERGLRVNFINTGVPHVVVFVSGLEKIDVDNIGRQVRYHKEFSPAGTNVNFVEILDKGTIRIRTYERGVEGETLACGTGSVASALIFALKSGALDKIKVATQSGEILKVYFNKDKNNFSDVWLEGRAKIVYKGEYNV